MGNKTTHTKIVNAADHLFYRRGFNRTSFADIACVVNISRGNFYYHFKSKDEILAAVIKLRFANTRAMLNRWQTQANTPQKRIEYFIQILVLNGDEIKKFGCPVGTLTGELSKLDHVLHPQAGGVFSLFREWLGEQFCQLGKSSNADELAIHLLARSQGVATLANALNDDSFVAHEVKQMCEWVSACADDV